jgi:glycosyltransferase involved in cell wall biosynthesis
MKILHIVGGDLTQGAHKGAYWLHQGLIEAGIDSKILGFIPPSQVGPTSVAHCSGRLGKVYDLFLQHQDHIWRTFYHESSSAQFHAAFFGRNINKSGLLKDVDLVHVHWVSNGVVNLKSIGNLDRPVVLSLRDMWSFTGGCHYSMQCKRYIYGCGACPVLGSNSVQDLSRWRARSKRRFLNKNHINVVGISSWISECARSSYIFEGMQVRTIPNNVDVNAFFAIDKIVARRLLGLPEHAAMVLVGASNLNSFYKGWSLFVDAINKVSVDDLHVVTFGRCPNGLQVSSASGVHHLGYISDELSLRIVYSAADVFVAPSVQEAFGKTLVEAMACETPVVCFDATGPSDIVEHRVTGYKAEPFRSEDLAHGVEWILNRRADIDMNRACRARAVALFSNEVVAEQHIALYRSLLG